MPESSDSRDGRAPAPSHGMPPRIHLIEVGPRDGFQMESQFVPTELKVRTIDRLAQSGVAEIEAVSFVHPQVIPQMRDAEAVMQTIERKRGVRYSALVPNLRGAERALRAEVDALHVVIAVTETYNRRNVGMDVAESVAHLEAIVAAADTVPVAVPVTATLAVAFGCPFEGQPRVDRVVQLARRLVDAGVDQVGLADTAGLGHPPLLRTIVRAVQTAVPDRVPRLHLHDTRGLGIANALAAMEVGVTTFDTSFGGLGGCPIMHGASGNVATEDLVNLCNEIGIATDVDLDVVRSVSRELEQFLGRHLPSHVLQSGTRAELLEANRD